MPIRLFDKARLISLYLQIPALVLGSDATRRLPIGPHERHGQQVTASGWSGYALTGSKGSVTHVIGSWVVPAVNCATTPNGAASFWVGIDGYDSNTVEQIGTDSDCTNGVASYYA